MVPCDDDPAEVFFCNHAGARQEDQVSKRVLCLSVQRTSKKAHLRKVHTEQLKKTASSKRGLNTLRKVDHTVDAPPPSVFFQKQGRQTQLVGLAQDLRHTDGQEQNGTLVPTSPAQLLPRNLGTSIRSQNERTGQNPAPHAVLIFV